MTVTVEESQLSTYHGCAHAPALRRTIGGVTMRHHGRRARIRHCAHQHVSVRPAASVPAPAAAPSQEDAGPAKLFTDLRLTEREVEVAELTVVGLSYAQIARDLFVSQSTVSYHLSNIYAKCGVRTRHELTALVRDVQLPAAA